MSVRDRDGCFYCSEATEGVREKTGDSERVALLLTVLRFVLLLKINSYQQKVFHILIYAQLKKNAKFYRFLNLGLIENLFKLFFFVRFSI